MQNIHWRLVMRGLLPLILWLAGCAATPREPVAVEQREWISQTGVTGVQLLTDHFDLRVTAQDEMLRAYLPTFMEEAFAQYEATLPAVRMVTSTTDTDDTQPQLVRTAQPGSSRLIVYLFNTRDQWALFTQGFSPERAETYLHILAGGYTDYPSATAVTYDVHRDRTLSLLAHEGMHQYLARFLPEPIPAWVNEGLATQWEAFELNGSHPNFTPRKNYSRRTNLRELLAAKDGLIPLHDLLGMDAGQALTGPRQPTRAFYAQVWSLVLFLKEGPCPVEYREGFHNLLADLGTNRMKTAIRAQRAATPDGGKITSGELLFCHYVTEDLAGAEAEYREFAQALVR